MRVTIDSRYEIDIDNIGNHTLIEHGRTEKGKAKETTIGYYKSVPSALKKYIDITVCESGDRILLGEYIKRYEMAVEKIGVKR